MVARDEIADPLVMVWFLLSKSKINDLSETYVSHYTNYDIAKKMDANTICYD